MPFRENISIPSFKHSVKTIKTMKLTLNRSDDKRVVQPDLVSTLAHASLRVHVKTSNTTTTTTTTTTAAANNTSHHDLLKIVFIYIYFFFFFKCIIYYLFIFSKICFRFIDLYIFYMS
jgi:hypothetical protein